MNMFAKNDDLPSERVINAASFGRLDDLRQALEDKGDPDYTRLNVCPTLIATLRGYDDCLALLIEKGARVDIPNQVGWTALHEASKKEDTTLLEIVLAAPDSQLKMFSVDDEGRSALFAAMGDNRFDNATLLLKREPELIDVNDHEGITPAMFAAQIKNAEWLEYLLKAGADITRTTSDQRTLADFVGPWDEGRYVLENTRAVVVEKTEAVKKVSKQEAQEEKNEEPVAPSNPFGLGGVKKKTLG